MDRPDYGLDAPGVIRNLLIVVAIGFVIRMSAAMGWWSGTIDLSPSATTHILLPLSRMVIWPSVGCALMAFWMVWDSKVGKVREREKLLDQIPWRGDERVLDVGCGRGLLLIAAAKRLSSGKAIGIDIWQSEDLSGNKPEATLRNAELEGVTSRVEVQTADMRKLPFSDREFDAVVSCAAIHNLYAAADRDQALHEIARVLKPGGYALIDDIRHYPQYARVLTAEGFAVRRVSSIALLLFLTFVTFGSLRPATLLAKKNV